MSTEIRSHQDESVSHRLPRTAVPKRYQIHLAPEIEKGLFSGNVDIAVAISTETDEILLNAVELIIESAQAVDINGRVHKASFSLDADNERVMLKFGKHLPPGDWKVQIDFRGTLNDKLHGFYRSAYKDDNGKEHVLAVTQCEPTDARRIFPCFDEPDFKAVFHTSVLVDKAAVALSNSPVESEKPDEDKSKKLVVFKDTMTMSTYLFALVVGDLEATESVDADGTPIRVWTPLGKLRLAAFSEQIAREALSFFNRYYGISYPGEKLDLVAVPDFMFGAMENLGCVIFRENALLVDQKSASQQELERIADIVAHELAHMWFGDLATMRWWNGLWLNEAFATFMNMLAINEMRPEWKRWDTFGVSRGQAFATDGLLSTRPIEFNVRKPEDAEGMFDVLTYEKGGSVLRMLEQYLGAEHFRLGIAHYLNSHQYGNTETTDLWDAIEEKSDQPVRQMMDSWIFQGGYPVVHASREESGKSWLITQHRFFYLPEEKRSHIRQDSVSHYHVPIMYKALVRGKIVEGRVLLQGNSTEIELEHPADW
ncbi:MAG: M1 family peptidase, partial [Leptolyngbya sp.]|nr:M1 family peptidase [Candidatus Melainabacteria bacterium]